ncbi:hypothetical protein O1R50_19775 [Glycomyces luteolus]|uniref:Uncharacterized protein n=1 Tax=Glycomyces luteolus TaxID=2670330 RepID=A0A9X3PDS6_9ACTN|nr:hypothetical protein [Glycomyces luteolus]MDA1361877.1 hypothetical protein [Glycomyces luteolus]
MEEFALGDDRGIDRRADPGGGDLADAPEGPEQIPTRLPAAVFIADGVVETGAPFGGAEDMELAPERGRRDVDGARDKARL